MTLIELCIVIVVLGVLLTLGIAGLTRARVMSNESSAIGGLRAIYSAQFSYTAGCGQGNYATTLVNLTTPPPGASEGYLSPELAGGNSPERNGYRFLMRAGSGALKTITDCHGSATQTRYYAAASPVVLGRTGTRAFATNQAGAIWQVHSGTPPSEPFAENGTVQMVK